MVCVEPQGKKARIFIGDDHLTSQELVFIPVYSEFVFAVLVEIMKDENVIVQVNATVLHHNLQSSNVSSMKKSPSRA